RAVVIGLVGVTVASLTNSPIDAASPIDELRTQLRSGEYDAAIRGAEEGIDQKQFGEDWYLVKAEAELATGQYGPAWETVQAGMQRYSWSVRLRWLGVTAARYSGDSAKAVTLLTEIQDLAGRSAWRYTDSDNLIALGRAALANG